MNTDALKTFLVLSELRSFRKTAQQLYIAQSTVSSRIQELERDLGQTLFDRKPRGMTLTPAGHRLIPIARRIVDLEKDLREEAVSKTVWQLNLGISDSIYYGCVDNFLPEFVYNYPDISLTVVSKSSSDMVNMLRDNELDLCVSFLPGSDPGLDTVVLSEDEIVLATTINNREYVSGIALGELWDQTLFYSECFSISRELGRWRSAVLPDNLSVLHHHEVQLRHERLRVPQAFQDEMLHASGTVHVPEALADEILHSPIVRRRLPANDTVMVMHLFCLLNVNPFTDGLAGGSQAVP